MTASTHQRCHRKPWRRRVPKSESRKPSSLRSRSTLAPQLGLGAGIEHVEGKPALALHHLARAQLVEDGERRNFPHRGVGPRPVEMQFVLAVDLVQLVFGQAEVGEPVDEVRREHLGLAVERIAGEPDQLLLGEADGAGVIELGAQLALVDDLGKAHMPAAVDDRKGDVLVRIEFPDHLHASAACRNRYRAGCARSDRAASRDCRSGSQCL